MKACSDLLLSMAQQAIVPPNWSDSPGAYGCLRSHLEIIKEARRLGWPNVLIFEDDAALDPELHEKFSSYFQQVPSDWEMLHFGANHMAAPVEVSANVVRITSANSTFAYALNRAVFDSFIELNTRALTAVDLNNRKLADRACLLLLHATPRVGGGSQFRRAGAAEVSLVFEGVAGASRYGDGSDPGSNGGDH